MSLLIIIKEKDLKFEFVFLLLLLLLPFQAVQNERQPRNSAQVRADSIDFHCDGNGTTVSVMHHRPTNSNSASSPGEGSTSSTKQDGKNKTEQRFDEFVHV